jgi:osmotically-inducible protein OsmY
MTRHARSLLPLLLGASLALAAVPVRADADANLAAKVRQALLAAHLPNAANLRVHSFNGAIDLSGVVYSEHSRTRAGQIVAAVPGVSAINNTLEVQPRVNDVDDATTARVRQALAAAQLADVGPIEVSTFNGEVDLSGIVYSQDALSQVIMITGATRGVVSVTSELEIRAR